MRTIEIDGAKALDDAKYITVDSPKATPIVFVPGVMGSRIKFKGAKWDPNPVWGVPSNMLWWAGLDPVTAADLLDVRGGDSATMMDEPMAYEARLVNIWKAVDPEQRKEFYGKIRGWSSVAKDFYHELLVSMEVYFNSDPFAPGTYPVYACGYDWRKSNADSGKKLAAKIKSISQSHDDAKVVVVTHSMGGLVARHAVHPGGGNVASLVKGVVHVVQPVNGAIQAYRRFAEGVGEDRHGIEGRVMAGILGGSWWGYTMLMSGTEGPLQLLPNHVYEGWLTDEKGKPLPAKQVYSYYASGSTQSLVPGLTTELAEKLSYKKVGNNPDPVKNFAEQYALSQSLPWNQDEIERARTKRVLERWAVYCGKLKTGLKNAEGYHKLVAGTAHPKTFMLYAKDRETEVGYDWSQEVDERIVKHAQGGDGTAPVASARGLDAAVKKAWSGKLPSGMMPYENLGGQEHSGVFNDQKVLDRVNLLVYLLSKSEA